MKPGQISQLGTSLVWVGNSSSNSLNFFRVDVSGMIAGDTSTAKSNWKNSALSGGVGKNGYNFETSYSPGSVTVGNSTYFFWTDTHNQGFCGARVTGTLTNGVWTYALDKNMVVLYDTSGAKISNKECDVTAIYYNGIISVYYIDDSTTFKSIQLDPAKWDGSNHKWQATSQSTGITFKALSLPNCNKFSADWFSLGSGNDYLMAAFYNMGNSMAYPIVFKLGENGQPNSTGWKAVDNIPSKEGCGIRRDAGGRIVATYGNNDSSHYAYTCTYNTLDNSGGAVGSPVLQTKFGPATLLNGVKHQVECAPYQFYLTAATYNDTVSLPLATGGKGNFNAQSGKVYQYVIYCDNNGSHNAYDAQAQITEFGKISLVPQVAKMLPSDPHRFLVNSIMDPFPLPQDMIDSTRDAVAATYYGTETGKTSGRSTSMNMQFGIKGNYKTTAGLGPAMEFQMSSGPSLTESSTITTTIETTYGSYSGAANMYQGGGKVLPFGEVYGMTLPPMYENGLYFFEADGDLVNDSGSPLYSQIYADIEASSSSSVGTYYTLFSSTPGNLSTYTTSAINANMQSLYNALPSSQKSMFPAAYNGNYFNGVVLPNAFAFNETSTSDPEKGKYLEFTIGYSTQKQLFEQLTTTFQEWGWTFNSSFYAGVSGGASASAGIGIFSLTFGGFTAEALAGFDFESEVTASEAQSQKIGISVDLSRVSPYPTPYTVRLYLLQPSDLWSKELQYFAPGNIAQLGNADLANSRPFKIFFRVMD